MEGYKWGIYFNLKYTKVYISFKMIKWGAKYLII